LKTLEFYDNGDDDDDDDEDDGDDDKVELTFIGHSVYALQC